MEKYLAQFMPPDYSAHGHDLDRLNAVVHWLMLILFVAWGAYFLYVLWRFSAKRNKKASYVGMQSHFSSYAEVGVAVVEVILLVGFSIPLWSRWNQRPPASTNPLHIRVVAEQFAWNAHYPGKDGVFGAADPKFTSSTNPLGLDPNDPHGKDDIATLNQLHLELNRAVLIDLSSKDVIHSFSLPVMRVKQDAIPGQTVAIHFTPTRTTNGDKWEIACAQLCGLGHYRMRGQFEVHTKADFEKWLATNAPENPETLAPNPVPAATPAQLPATDTEHH
jgi:cytochrome c oxidase subunit 2